MGAQSSAGKFVQQARELAPLLRETAREAELARQPLDRVIDAVRETDLFSMMTPKYYGGHEADIDDFFEVSLILSEADTSMGWLIGFYIEHCFWFCHYPKSVQDEIFGDNNYALAPGALSVAGGKATPVDGGYRLSGQWQWGTGIVHATWVMAGALLDKGGGTIVPMFFVLPREETETIDTWHMAGMCATGSHDFKIDDVFVPEERARPFVDLLTLNTGISKLYDAPLYRTPMLPILAIAAGTPCLGAAKRAVAEFKEQSKQKLDMSTGKVRSENPSRQVTAAHAALEVEMAESMMRSVVADVMEQRIDAPIATRAAWLARMTHAVATCRAAINKICEASGAGSNNLANPLQRCLRDVNTAANHVVFDRDSRYRDFGRTLVDMDPTSALL